MVKGAKMIPCKECLVLAACKSKRRIECEAAYEWIHDGNIRNNRIKMLSKLLPCWEEIYMRDKVQYKWRKTTLNTARREKRLKP